MDFNALNAMYVKDAFCSFYAIMYTEYRSDVRGDKGTLDTVVSHSSRREGLYSLHFVGLVVHHLSGHHHAMIH